MMPLVREIRQNSLDAAHDIDTAPVGVEFERYNLAGVLQGQGVISVPWAVISARLARGGRTGAGFTCRKWMVQRARAAPAQTAAALERMRSLRSLGFPAATPKSKLWIQPVADVWSGSCSVLWGGRRKVPAGMPAKTR